MVTKSQARVWRVGETVEHQGVLVVVELVERVSSKTIRVSVVAPNGNRSAFDVRQAVGQVSV